MAGIKGEEFRRTGNVFVNQFMDKQWQSKPDSFSSMKVKLNRLLHWTSRGAAVRGNVEGGRGSRTMQGKWSLWFFWYLFFWLPRIMGCVGSINASQTSVMNDLMFLFVIQLVRRRERERERATCDLNKPHKATKSRGEKKSPIIVLISLFVPSLGASSSGRTMRGRPQLVT